MKIIYVKKNLTVILSNELVLTKLDCSEELFNKIQDLQEDEQAVINLLAPTFHAKQEEYKKELKEFEELKEILEEKSDSIISEKDGKFYISDISEISLPKDFVLAIKEAEKNNDTNLIETYKNFWTLVSLNPNAQARDNMFWFLNKYGFKISKSGLFVAYRLVDIKEKGTKYSKELISFVNNCIIKIKGQKQSPKKYKIFQNIEGEYFCVKEDRVLENDVKVIGNLFELFNSFNENKEDTDTYTDNRTKTFKIKIGQLVSMNRKNCDENQNVTCSSGLHVASKNWLENNFYFGSNALAVLVNPADVVAVPKQDSYGKMRTCAYFPILNVKVENRKLEEVDIPNGFEDDFFNIMINYNGKINNEDVGQYQIIPEKPTEDFNEKKILNKLSEIKLLLSKREAE